MRAWFTSRVNSSQNSFNFNTASFNCIDIS